MGRDLPLIPATKLIDVLYSLIPDGTMLAWVGGYTAASTLRAVFVGVSRGAIFGRSKRESRRVLAALRNALAPPAVLRSHAGSFVRSLIWPPFPSSRAPTRPRGRRL